MWLKCGHGDGLAGLSRPMGGFLRPGLAMPISSSWLRNAHLCCVAKIREFIGSGVDTCVSPRLYTGPYGAPSANTVRLRAFEAPH